MVLFLLYHTRGLSMESPSCLKKEREPGRELVAAEVVV